MLPKFSIAIESLEIGIFYLPPNKDYAGGFAATHFHVALCPCAGERLLLPSSMVSPELLC